MAEIDETRTFSLCVNYTVCVCEGDKHRQTYTDTDTNTLIDSTNKPTHIEQADARDPVPTSSKVAQSKAELVFGGF